MAGDGKGTPKVRALGAELREHRESAGLTLRKLATKLGKHHSVLARYETGEKRPEPETVAVIMTALGASPDERSRLVELARAAGDTNWVAVGDPSHRDMTTLIEYERTARSIVEVATTVVPGVLQTYDYAHAIISKWSPHDANVRTMTRIGRRDVLTKQNAPEFTAIITENALREPIGGTAVHAGQLRYLTTAAEADNVEILVVRSGTSEWNPSHAGSFIHFTFGKGEPIVYIEHFSSLTLLQSSKEVKAFRDAITTLRDVAMDRADSAKFIAALAAAAEGDTSHEPQRTPAELA